MQIQTLFIFFELGLLILIVGLVVWAIRSSKKKVNEE